MGKKNKKTSLRTFGQRATSFDTCSLQVYCLPVLVIVTEQPMHWGW